MKPGTIVSKLGIRHVEAGLLFLLTTVIIGMRAQLSMAMVAMTDLNKTTTANPDVPVYDWNNQSTMLSSFLWGYLWLQVIAGNVGRIYGTKWFLLIAMTINSTLSCLLPLFAHWMGSYGVMLCRCLQGLSQGFFYPSIHNLISLWSPISERGVFSSIAFSGSPFGTIITMPIVGYISSSWWGWPASFYLYGGLGYLWVILYFFLGADSPDKHPWISEREKRYIKSDLGEETGKMQVPWKAILTNRPFWVIWINAVAQFWCWQTLLAEMPTYMSKILKYDIKSNGVLSSIPYIVNFVTLIVAGSLSDIIIKKNIMSTIWTRKMFTLLGSMIPALSLLALGFVPDDERTLSVILLVIGVGIPASCGVGSGINHIDIAPSFAGIVLAIINSCGSFVSIFGPLSVQLIDENKKGQWAIIFTIAAVMYGISSILFLFFATADIQDFDPANKEKMTKRKMREKKHSVISVISM
ncbi:sialin-like isoform X2 [Diabrotica undecimpunctata]|uniref:sialin-like isoform X1 n=1 Tax=Diabrotica undecimpunctata TaxID=50387 RepID=UPI003B642903